MDGVPDLGRTGGGSEPGPSSSTLLDYEDEIEPGMEGHSPEGQENELVYEEEFGMEVEPDPDEGSLPKERSYSIKSNQSDSSVSEKAKKNSLLKTGLVLAKSKTRKQVVSTLR